MLFDKETPAKNLWILFKTYGSHNAAVKICDRAITGDKDALEYAEKIWNKEF